MQTATVAGWGGWFGSAPLKLRGCDQVNVGRLCHFMGEMGFRQGKAQSPVFLWESLTMSV